MSTPIFDPEDPRLTAYALGETLPPADRAEVETLLQQSPEARAAMKDIQDITASLTTEYDQERLGAEPAASDLPPNVVRLPQATTDSRWTWVRPLLAAAAILLATAGLASLTPSFNGVWARKEGAPKLATLQPAPAPPKVTVIEPAAPTAELSPELTAPKDEAKAKLAQLDEPAQVARPMHEGRRVDAFDPGPYIAKDSSNVPSLIDPLDSTDSDVSRAKSAATLPVGPPGATVRNAAPLFGYQPAAPAPVNRAALPPMPLAAAPALATLKAQPMLAFGGSSGAGAGYGRNGAGNGTDRNPESRARLAKLNSSSTFGLDADATQPPSSESKPVFDGADYIMRSSSFNTAAYDHLTENPFLTAKENPLSTFSIDVDTASYANVRRFIEGGSLPPPDAVRVEELINYFPYDYAPPAPDSGQAFAVHLEAAACPWAPPHRLVRIGLKGREIATDKRPASNLVFLIDVSGSMKPPERLPLIKRALSMLTEHLTGNDRVAIVTYAGNSGLALPSTSGDHKDAILGALDRLEAGGSTNGGSGIKLAYKVAKANFIKGGTNRVILATDGDFNVGVTGQGDLIRLIQDEARSGVFLSALGVGTDNFKDSTMQKLADKGNGNYSYIDRLEEARKVLVEQMSGTLLTIAKDVKIQVEFNPAAVAAYRLIGYEKRTLRKEDFNDDRIDAGEIGAGHSVTALYEVVPVGQPTPEAAPAVDALKYGTPTLDADARPEAHREMATDAAKRVVSPEMLTVKIRHKAPDAEQSEKSYEEALTDQGSPDGFAKASADFKFAAAVAEFGLSLRDSPHKGNATLGAAVELAQEGKGSDAKGHRAEFIELARRAQALQDAR